MKKAGNTARVVNRAEAKAETVSGTIGVKVSILSPDVKIHDQIKIDEELLEEIKENIEKAGQEIKEKEKKGKKK